MNQVEQRLALAETAGKPIPDSGQLLALVDALSSGTLNKAQEETIQLLRQGILTWGEEVSRALDKAELIC